MIGIIGAMDCEVSLLLSQMTGVSAGRVGAHTFYTGELAGCCCVLAQDKRTCKQMKQCRLRR